MKTTGPVRSSRPRQGEVEGGAVVGVRRAPQASPMPFDDRAAEEYGKVREHLAALGTPIGPNDLMIAVIARVNQLTLVTHNTTEFGRVPGLTLEDWQ